MEQIVKIFVHQSYFMENDLVIDYNVQQGAQVNVSPEDWIALIPKGWSGVDEQVAFKTVNSDIDENLAIKSVIMEKKCFQNVVECEKQYQLMYISQYLEILGKSEYFVFLHQSSLCNCVTSSTKIKDNLEQIRLPQSVFSRKLQRRPSPTPHEFYKNRPQSHSIVKNEKMKSKQWSSNTCVKCNAPTNFAALESAYLTKIQDLTVSNEIMEQQILKVENDLVHTLDVVNKQLQLNKTLTEEKDKNQKFIDDVIDGLMIDGKITFWARDDEFSIVREFPHTNQISPTSDDCTALLNNTSLNSSKEAYMKAIIGQQEKTIQCLVNKIKDSFDIFYKVVNTEFTDQNISSLTTSENKISNVGYMDVSGTTYFSPPPYITNNLNYANFYPSCGMTNNIIETKGNNFKQTNNFANNIVGDNGFSDTQECKVMSTVNHKIKDEVLTFENWKKDENDSSLMPHSCTNEKTNLLDDIKQNDNRDTTESDDSL